MSKIRLRVYYSGDYLFMKQKKQINKYNSIHFRKPYCRVYRGHDVVLQLILSVCACCIARGYVLIFAATNRTPFPRAQRDGVIV